MPDGREHYDGSAAALGLPLPARRGHGVEMPPTSRSASSTSSAASAGVHPASGLQRHWSVPQRIGWLVPRARGAGSPGCRKASSPLRSTPPAARRPHRRWLHKLHADDSPMRLNDAKGRRAQSGSGSAAWTAATDARSAASIAWTPDGGLAVVDDGYCVIIWPRPSAPDGRAVPPDSALRRVCLRPGRRRRRLSRKRTWLEFDADGATRRRPPMPPGRSGSPTGAAPASPAATPATARTA